MLGGRWAGAGVRLCGPLECFEEPACLSSIIGGVSVSGSIHEGFKTLNCEVAACELYLA